MRCHMLTICWINIHVHLIGSILTQGGGGPANHCHSIQGIKCEQPDQRGQQITAHAAKQCPELWRGNTLPTACTIQVTSYCTYLA